MPGSFGWQEQSRVSRRTLRQVSGRVTVVFSGPGFSSGLAPNVVFRGIISGSRCPAQCRVWYSGEFTSSSGCSAGVSPPAGYHSHGVLGTCPNPPAWDPAVGTLVRTASSIAQVIAGPPVTLVMGALLTSKVVDIAIGYMRLHGYCHRW